MKTFIYVADGFKEIPVTDKGKIELYNRELPKELQYKVYEGDVFPPIGKKLVNGQLIDKTEKEKVETGEISLVEIQNRIVTQINILCEKAIISGFESNALGEVHIYDSEETDQINLIGSVAAGGSVPYKCQNKSTGVKGFLTHTNTQIKKVLNDGAVRKSLLLQNCGEKKAAVRALNDYDSVVGFDISAGWE